MRIHLTSMLVDDQDKALRFYTDVLGFQKTDAPLGEARWLTVVAPEAPDGPELALEPDAHPAASAGRARTVTPSMAWSVAPDMTASNIACRCGEVVW